MKKHLYAIIFIFLFFAISRSTFAAEGYIEELLEFKSGVEKLDLESTSKLDNIHFTNTETATTFSKFKVANSLLKNEFIRLYRVEKLNYNDINGVIRDYNYFIYHINRMFIYKRIKEIHWTSREVNIAILRNYKQARLYYFRIKNIINKAINS